MEEWKTVIYHSEIYEKYEVSTEGNVRNRKTKKSMSQNDNGRGYLKVMLYNKDKRKCVSVHRIVAEVFIPNPNNYDTVDHINHNKHDNRVENLRWLSHKNNSSNGYFYQQRKVKCLETGQIFDSISQASKETNVSVGGICDCCSGKLESTKGLHFKYLD